MIKMVYTISCSHPLPSLPPLPCTATNSHSLPSTPIIHFYSFLTHSYSFPVFSHPLSFMFGSLLLVLNPLQTICRLSHPFPVHTQIQPIEQIISNRTHHLPLQPIFSPCIYVPTCFTYLCVCAFVFHMPMCLCNLFLCTFLPRYIYFTCLCVC